MRFRGQNTVEMENIKIGQYHSLTVSPNRMFTIQKEAWDTVDIDRIKQASDPQNSADVGVILITVCANNHAHRCCLNNGRMHCDHELLFCSFSLTSCSSCTLRDCMQA